MDLRRSYKPSLIDHAKKHELVRGFSAINVKFQTHATFF